MKKYMLLTATVLALAIPGAAWSQTAPSGGNGGPPPGGPQGGGQHEQGDGQHFQEHKARALEMLNHHLQEVQQRIGCVQAAANHEALRACMPERRGGGEGHGEGGGPGAGAPGGER